MTIRRLTAEEVAERNRSIGPLVMAYRERMSRLRAGRAQREAGGLFGDLDGTEWSGYITMFNKKRIRITGELVDDQHGKRILVRFLDDWYTPQDVNGVYATPATSNNLTFKAFIYHPLEFRSDEHGEGEWFKFAFLGNQNRPTGRGREQAFRIRAGRREGPGRPSAW